MIKKARERKEKEGRKEDKDGRREIFNDQEK